MAKKLNLNLSGFKTKAFTLIELLVVVAIISMLSSVVLSQTQLARTRAYDSNRIAQMDEVSKALELYYTNTGAYPNVAPMFDADVPQQWQSMLQTLNTAGFLSVKFTWLQKIEKMLAILDTSTAYAAFVPPYYTSSIQDRRYVTGDDYLFSYGYTVANGGSAYIIRVNLENAANKPKSTAYTGSFFVAPGASGTGDCSVASNYYCVAKGF